MKNYTTSVYDVTEICQDNAAHGQPYDYQLPGQTTLKKQSRAGMTYMPATIVLEGHLGH
jgi:hypothetical protein